jgi:CRP/FNR family transcriptional regulator, cyclic AMP receptor protein
VDPPADPFGAALDEPGRRRFATLGRVRRYAAGATLFVEGDRGANVLVIRSGRVKVTKVTPEGHELVLALRGPGALVGELASLDEARRGRSATVSALVAVQAQVIANDDFTDFLEQHPKALLALTRIIIGRLHDADRRRAEFGTYDTLGRLARVLAELAAGSGLVTDEGVRLEPALAQHELAGLVGASRESVVRALGELRRRGMVETGRRRLIVRDAAALAELAR